MLQSNEALSVAAFAMPRLAAAALLPGFAALLPGLLLILLLLTLRLLCAALSSSRIVLLRALSVLRALLLSCHLVKPPGVYPQLG